AFAAKLDAVVLLPVNADQCRQALFADDGIAAYLQPGTPVMVSATIAASDSRAIHAQLRKRSLALLDAPVSGGPAKAASGDLTVMAAGAPETFVKLRPLLDTIAGEVFE